MVGVAGRSRGCNTCRRRKKGCDQQRPTCGQCVKAGIECEGYERERVFVNFSEQTSARRASNAPSVRTRAASSGHKAATSVRRSNKHDPQWQVASSSAVSSPSSSEDLTLAPTLARSAYREKLLNLFLDHYLPSGQAFSSSSTQYVHGSWATIARDLQPRDPVLQKVVLAMGMSTIGRYEGERWMWEDGLKAYVESLGEMEQALRDPERAKSDAVITASRGLALFEIFHGKQSKIQAQDAISQVNSWQGHSGGELALMLARGPEGFVEGYAHTIFTDGRMNLMISACSRRKRCFLSDPAWKTIPWQKIPKTPKDGLIDIMVDLPGVLEDFYILLALPSDSDRRPALQRHIITESWRIERELQWWHEHLSPRLPFAELQSRGHKNPSPHDVAITQSMTLYWTACLTTYCTLRETMALDPDIAPRIAQLPPHTEPMIYARLITAALEVLFQPTAGSLSWHSVPYPMGAVFWYLIGNIKDGDPLSPELKKLLGYCTDYQGGVWMADFLKSILGREPFEIVAHYISTQDGSLGSPGDSAPSVRDLTSISRVSRATSSDAGALFTIVAE